MYFGGVLGGGSHTEVVITKKDGEIVGYSEGEGCNPWDTGFDKCAEIIAKLVIEAKRNAGLDSTIVLESLGMSLSGGEQKEAQERIVGALSSLKPPLSQHYCVCTDTFAPVAVAFPNGGMVLISGTGSNCELITSSGETHRCGGWGHMLGDEGSAYWIAHRAIKLVYDVDDGLRSTSSDITALKNTVTTFFNLKSKYDILDHVYEKFKKSNIAMLCKELSTVAQDTQDPLCRQVFYDAGEQLGNHVMALLPKVHENLIKQYGYVPVVLEGKVFESWDLLNEGFKKAVATAIHPIKLYKISQNCKASLGAAVIGAKQAGMALTINYEKNVTLFYEFSSS